MDFQVNFNSQFDSTQVLKGLEEVRKKMGDLSADQTIFKGVDKDFAKITKQIADLQIKSKNLSSSSDFNAYNRQLESIKETATRISQGLTQIANNDDKAFNFKDIQAYKKQLNDLNKELNEAKGIMGNLEGKMGKTLSGLGFDETATQNIVKDLKEQLSIEQAIKNEVQRRLQLAQELVEKGHALMETNVSSTNKRKFFSAASTINQNEAGYIKSEQATELASNIAFNRIKNSIPNVENAKKLEEVIQLINKDLAEQNLKFSSQEVTLKEIEKLYNERLNQMKEIDNGITNTYNSADMRAQVEKIRNNKGKGYDTDINAQIEDYQKLNNAINEINNDIKETENHGKNLDSQKTLSNLGEDAQKAESDIKRLADSEKIVVNNQQEIVDKQNAINKVFDRVGSIIKNVLSLGNAWRKANQYIRQTFQDIEKLDKAFASIAMVTKYSVEDLWGQYSQYSEIANRLGQTTEGAIKSSALFYQQGLDTNEVLSLTEDTLKMATLAGEDYTTATKQMTAALRGFSMEMEEGSRVTDVYSELAANAAADVKGIAYAMSKTSSIEASAGMGFETTAAFITNMIETTQEAPKQKLIA